MRLTVSTCSESSIRKVDYVHDHCTALWAVLNRGQAGETYNIGAYHDESGLRHHVGASLATPAHLNSPKF